MHVMYGILHKQKSQGWGKVYQCQGAAVAFFFSNYENKM